jgi:Protein of unknown function (DUF2905)
VEPLPGIGRILIFIGLAIVGLGLLLTVVGKVPFIGRLPGDIVFRRGNVTFYFPLATSILLSILLTVILWLIRR